MRIESTGNESLTGAYGIVIGIAQRGTPEHAARHLFGHYLADLHADRHEYSDAVADAVASMLDEVWSPR